MVDTRLIMLEGLPGTGKTTNSDFLRIQLELNGNKVNWIHEVSCPHPTSSFDEANFTIIEFKEFLKLNHQSSEILNNLAIFRKNTVGINLLEIEWNFKDIIDENVFKALRQYDVWEFSYDNFYKVTLDKWTKFVEKVLENSKEIYILDSSIFQFLIFYILLKNEPYEHLEKLVHKIIELILPLNPCLIYFYRENTELTIDYLVKDRGINFLEWIYNRDKKQPYYKDKPKGAEGHKQFLRDYSKYAELLLGSINCRKLPIEISEGDWESYEISMLSSLKKNKKLLPKFYPINGVYKNDDKKYEIIVESLKMIDPNGKQRKLIPKNEKEFYIEGLPLILFFEEPGYIVLRGQQINAHWTIKGMKFKK